MAFSSFRIELTNVRWEIEPLICSGGVDRSRCYIDNGFSSAFISQNLAAQNLQLEFSLSFFAVTWRYCCDEEVESMGEGKY